MVQSLIASLLLLSQIPGTPTGSDDSLKPTEQTRALGEQTRALALDREKTLDRGEQTLALDRGDRGDRALIAPLVVGVVGAGAKKVFKKVVGAGASKVVKEVLKNGAKKVLKTVIGEGASNVLSDVYSKVKGKVKGYFRDDDDAAADDDDGVVGAELTKLIEAVKLIENVIENVRLADAAEQPYQLLKKDVDCNGNEVFLASGISLKKCAELCKQEEDCRYFTYGDSNIYGDRSCFQENTSSDTCDDDFRSSVGWNFYKTTEAATTTTTTGFTDAQPTNQPTTTTTPTTRRLGAPRSK